MSISIEQDFISLNELLDIYPDVSRADWLALAKGLGIEAVRRCPDDPHFNPRKRRILGFLDLDLNEMQRIYRSLEQEQRKHEDMSREEREEFSNPFLRYGAISLSEISRQNRIGVKKLKAVLTELGIVPGEYIFGNQLPGEGLNKSQYSSIRPFLKMHRRMLPSSKVKSIKTWAAALRLDEDTLYLRALQAGVSPRMYIFHGMPAIGFKRKEIDLILKAFPDLERRLNVPLAKQTDMAISPVARGAGLDVRTLRNLLRDAEIVPVDRMYPNGKVGETLTKQQRSALCLTYLKLMDEQQNPSEKLQYLTQWARELDLHTKTFRVLMEGACVKPIIRNTAKREFELLTQTQVDQIAIAYEPFNRPENKPISVDVYARQNNTSPSVVMELARAAKIDVGTHLFRNKNAPGLFPHQIETLEQTYKPFVELEDPLDATVSLSSYATQRSTTAITVERRLRSIGIEPVVRPNPNGARKAKSMTMREQIALEKHFPDLSIER